MFGFYKKISVNNKIVNKFLRVIESDEEGKESGPISKTSWNTGGKIRGDLNKLFEEYLRKKIERRLGKVKVLDLWYQTYRSNSGSFHDWHIHPDSDYSITFFIKMKKDKSLLTEFNINGKIKKPWFGVGDCVIFDSRIVHRGPPNNTDSDKIIVSSNLIVQ